MNEQDHQKNPQNKPYREQDSHIIVAKEPEIMYETKTNVSFEEDFNRALATAITPEEFMQHMYQRIQAWPWKEK